jgi:hypothetical protein
MEKIIYDAKHLWNEHKKVGAAVIVILVIAIIL